MNADYFLDTNTLLYCFDPLDPRKQQIAVMLVEDAVNGARGVISDQVCGEFCNVMLHKLRDAFPPAVLDDYLETHLFPLIRVHPSPQLFREAIRIHRLTQYRFYDSLIVAAALESGATILYSEDLQHDRTIGHLRIVNPFISTTLQKLATACGFFRLLISRLLLGGGGDFRFLSSLLRCSGGC